MLHSSPQCTLLPTGHERDAGADFFVTHVFLQTFTESSYLLSCLLKRGENADI